VREARDNTEYPSGWRPAVDLALNTLAPGLGKLLRRRRTGEWQLFASAYRPAPGISLRAREPAEFSERMLANMGYAKMNYWLRSANKANFGIPIEPRAPFLDYRLLEFAFSLPPEYLIRKGWHKWILRIAMEQVLPPEVVWRRAKMGFPFPLEDWLLASRAQIAANLADADCPYIHFQGLMECYEASARDSPFALWRIVNLGLWWRRVIQGRPIVPVAQ
jgi:asparagine synthetase B (glutamine-hydrolysing)